MGLLDAFKQYLADAMPGGLLNPELSKDNIGRIAEEVNKGLLSSTGINARDKRRAWDREKLDAVSGSSDTRMSLNRDAYETAMNMAGMAPMGITVWHGSPHKFDKFDMSKIGTGEGAQAYGHGLYMAESPEVAQTYAPANQQFMQKVASSIDKSNGPRQEVLEMFHKLRLGTGFGSPAGIKQRIESIIENEGVDSQYAKGLRKVYSQIEKEYLKNPGGQLYKVDIPDEAVARMLDWDKPLSQQAPEVQKAIEGSPYALRDMAMMVTGNNDPLGGEIIKTVMNPNEIAIHLRQQGIPGIRYLDGRSRAGGQGTSNYVLFSDQLPRILEVNGSPTGQLPWAAGEWQGLLGK